MSDFLSYSDKRMFYAIQSDNISEFKNSFLLDKVNKQVTNSDGATFLGEAVKRGSIKIVNFILDNYPEEMNKKDKNESLPLAYVRRSANRELILESFRLHGFNFSLDLGTRGNILHVIAPHGNGELFDSLVKNGANPNGENNRKDKPLNIASRWGNHVLANYINKYYNNETSFEFN